jgi:4-alpha-glucanotransferase
MVGMTSPFAGRLLGVLLHPSSFFGRDDIGTFGAEAHRFVDWLAQAGAGIWQILPLTMNGQHDSPYFSASAFAVSPWLVDLPDLQAHGLLPEPALHRRVLDARVPFDALPATKLPQLVAAARRFLALESHPWRERFEEFRAEQDWLTDTAHFFALRDQHVGAPWWEWPEPLRTREEEAVRASRDALAAQIAVWQAIFFFADVQWHALLAHAHERGLSVLGDLPIYVAHDSADVWVAQEEFQLDGLGRLTAQSGVPPDYFSETGQLWGNPLYRWDRMASEGYAWWVRRLHRCLTLTDVVRIDHFRALSAYWEVPAGALDARGGRWVPGPGQAFLDALAEEFPGLPFVAEDLGTLDDDVHRLRDRNGLVGMRVLQFGFDGTSDNPHQPHNFPNACIVYTGTHDNQPAAGWWDCLGDSQREQVARYYQIDPWASPGRAVWALIEAAIGSRADVAVVPMQDLLVLDDRARMNDPSVFVGNWSWRLPPDGLSAELAASLRTLAERYGRLP